MRLFGSLRRVKPKTFTYIPQFYDERKERLDNLIADADSDQPKDTRAIKARIQMGFSSRPYYYDKTNSASKLRRKSNIRTLGIFLVLLLIALIYLGNNSKAILEVAQ